MNRKEGIPRRRRGLASELAERAIARLFAKLKHLLRGTAARNVDTICSAVGRPAS